MKSFPYARTFLLGFGFFGISLIWPIFNNYVPIFLKEFGLSATLIGFVMTWDNYINLFVQPIVGERSDRTRTRFGRRKPWLMVGAPLAALFFIFIPQVRGMAAMMFVVLLTNLSMALFRSPTVALLGDLFPASQRSTANGIINLMGGIGAILAFLVGGALYTLGRITPFVFGALVMLAAIGTVVLLVHEPETATPSAEEKSRAGVWQNLREVLQSSDRSGVYILLAILFWFMGYNAIDTWISSFGKFTLGIDEGQMSMYSSALALSFVVFALPGGIIASRFGRRRVILVGLSGLVLLCAYGLLVGNAVSLLFFLIPAGMFWALVNVNSLPMVYDVGGDARVGAFTGLYYLASSIAAVAGPQIVGILIDLTGENYRLMFIFAAVFMGLAAWCMKQVHEKHAVNAA